MRARVAVINQIKGLLVAAPETLRARYRALTTPALIAALARCRPSGPLTDPEITTTKALKRLAVRCRYLEEEIGVIDSETDQVITAHAPLLRDLHGVGTDVASQLLITAGDNPERIRNQATFAALTGVAPIPASSGKTSRHRLSRGGDRAANSAIHHVVLVRMTSDTRTQAYVQRRRAEGKSTKDIIRCLKRYVAREIYAQLTNPKPAPEGAVLREIRKRGNISLDTASTAIGVNANKLSRLERGKTRDDDLYETYKIWLQAQHQKTEQAA